jgi:hypothetical protein
MSVVEILKVGFTGFGFLLAWMAFNKLNELGEKLLKSPNTNREVATKLLQAFRVNQILACVFFVIACVLTAISLLRPSPPLSISVYPSQGGYDRMVVIRRDNVPLRATEGRIEFIVSDRTVLMVDVNEMVEKMKATLALNTAALQDSARRLGAQPADGGPDAFH